MTTPAAIAANEREPVTVAECDAALRLLRVARREGSVEARELAQLAIDDVLDRRLELTREGR